MYVKNHTADREVLYITPKDGKCIIIQSLLNEYEPQKLGEKRESDKLSNSVEDWRGGGYNTPANSQPFLLSMLQYICSI